MAATTTAVAVSFGYYALQRSASYKTPAPVICSHGLILSSQYTLVNLPLLGLTLLASDVAYAYWHESGRDNRIDAVMEETDPIPADPDIVDRPDAEKMVELVIKSPPTKYDIIVGNHGTGKSTLVYRLARRLPGVIYVAVPSAESRTESRTGSTDVRSRFVRALEAALDLGHTYTWSRVIFSKVITTLEPGKHAPPFCFVYMLMYSVKTACQLMKHISVGWRISRVPLRATRRSISPGQ
jgi:hypothetical protein